MSITIRKVLAKDIIAKVWGFENIVVNNEHYCGKLMTLLPRLQSSLHYHPVKNETMYITGGRMQIESPKDHFRTVVIGDIIDIPANVEHRFVNPFEYPCSFYEFSQPHDDNDVVRIEDSRSV